MYKIQCDKSFLNLLKNTFALLDLSAEISLLSSDKTDISIIRNNEKISFFSDYIIVNSDNKELLNILKGCKSTIITCGLSTRSTVTFSSISDDKCVMCTQRKINTLSGNTIQPFEIPFEIIGKSYDEVSVLMIITAALLCGAKVTQLKKIYL